MSATNAEQDRQFVQVVINDHRTDQIGRFVHENFVEQNPPPGQGRAVTDCDSSWRRSWPPSRI